MLRRLAGTRDRPADMDPMSNAKRRPQKPAGNSGGRPLRDGPLPAVKAFQARLDAEFIEARDRQAAGARALAERLERGLPVNGLGLAFTAALLRHWADTRPAERPRGPGAPASFDRDEAVSWLVLVTEFAPDPPTLTAAVGELLDRLPGVEVEAVRRAHQEKRAAWRRWFLALGCRPTRRTACERVANTRRVQAKRRQVRN